jgi:hypothetical protein
MTLEDRASQFVNQLLEEFSKIKAQNAAVPIQAFEKIDLYFMTLKLLEKQASFLSSDVDGTVDIGYHYTSASYLKHIQIYGLLTTNEREQRGILIGRLCGAAFGEGIYTADNLFAFHNYGYDVCLICVRLRGTVKYATTQNGRKNDSSTHCVIGNKVLESLLTVSHTTHYANEVVLQSSSQIIPVLQFEREVVTLYENPPNPHYATWRDAQIQSIMDKYITTLQKVVNSTFNSPRYRGKTRERRR